MLLSLSDPAIVPEGHVKDMSYNHVIMLQGTLVTSESVDPNANLWFCPCFQVDNTIIFILEGG